MHASEFPKYRFTQYILKYIMFYHVDSCALLPEVFYFFNVKNKRTEKSKTKEIRAHKPN
jgi:hypothetical protein